MKTSQRKTKKKFRVNSSGLIIFLCFIVAVAIYTLIFGNPSNFVNNDPRNHALDGNLLGTIYKGGIIVPLIQTLLLTVLTFSVERYIALKKAQGKNNLIDFAVNIKTSLLKNDLNEARDICNTQQGSVANVALSAIDKYEQVEKDNTLTKEQRLISIQKEIEESTALELPMLSQNLPIVATITTLGTLMGLLGTVIGMIRSFAALAGAGGTDSLALSQGISEALINTAFGIATGALAVISYNFFTSKIDSITYFIDEVGFTIVQSFAANHK